MKIQKVSSQQSRPLQTTRKGVKANHSSSGLVNVTNGEVVNRVSRLIAAQRVASGEWKYCPKKFKIKEPLSG